MLVTVFAGVVSVGAVVSLPITVMICVQDAVPTAFVAVQVIVVWPAGNGSVSARPSPLTPHGALSGQASPGGDAAPLVTGVPISAAVAVYVHPFVELNVLLTGQLIAGMSS